MDLTCLPPDSGASVRSSARSHASRRSRHRWVVAAAVLGLAAAGAEAQRPTYGQECRPYAAPPGYPPDLVGVPAGYARLGITAKEAREIAKQFGHGLSVESYLRLLVREVGDQESLVPAFLLGVHEVTNKQYHAFVKAKWPKVRFPFDWWLEADINEHREAFYKKRKDTRGVSFKPKEYWEQNYADLRWELPKGQEDYPVTYVSYNEAQAYCAWAGMRLPYETEWQLALQGAGKKPPRYLWGKKWDEATCLKILRLTSPRDAKKRPVGSCPSARTSCGIEDLLAGVWEWTAQPFLAFDGYDKQLKALEKWRRKKKMKPITLPLWRADMRVVRGGSYTSRAQAGIVFRCNTRMPLSTSQTVEDLGFRVAKSLVPGFDTTVLWFRRDFDKDSLGDLTLDLPTTRDIRYGTGKSFEQRGIERWDTAGETIKGYHMVSFAPVQKLAFKLEKDLAKASYEKPKDGAHGVPIAAVFSTEPFSVQQGLKQEVALDPDMYVVSFRAKGMPRELEIAMFEGARVLKANKGVRPAKGTKEAEPKKKGAKKKKKKKKKGAAEQRSKIDWMKVVDHYGIPDEVTAKFNRQNRPTDMLIQPGKLRIPIHKKILLFRKHDGDYVAWAEYIPGLHLRGIANSKPRLEFVRGDRVEYTGGPHNALLSTKRYEFKIRIKLAPGEGNKNWITSATLEDIAKNGFEKRAGPVHASPTDGNGRPTKSGKKDKKK